MKVYILFRMVLIGIFAFTLRFLFDGEIDAKDIIAPLVFAVLWINEYFYKKKKDNDTN